MTMSEKVEHTELRKLAEAATPGPWYDTNGAVWIDTRQQVCCGRSYEECCGNPDIEGGQEQVADSSPTDAAFIAAANPETVLALLAERDRLLDLLTRIRDELGYGDLPARLRNFIEECNAALKDTNQ